MYVVSCMYDVNIEPIFCWTLIDHGKNSHADMGKYQAMCTWYPRIGYNFRASVRRGLKRPDRRGPRNPT